MNKLSPHTRAVLQAFFVTFLWSTAWVLIKIGLTPIINNTMLIQIAILAWLFLSEALTTPKIIGLSFASVGAVIVAIRLTHR